MTDNRNWWYICASVITQLSVAAAAVDCSLRFLAATYLREYLDGQHSLFAFLFPASVTIVAACLVLPAYFSRSTAWRFNFFIVIFVQFVASWQGGISVPNHLFTNICLLTGLLVTAMSLLIRHRYASDVPKLDLDEW
jgi:hypothetical protein